MAPSPRAQVRSWLRPGEGRTGTVPGILRGGLQEQGCHLDGRWEAKWFAQEGPGSGGLKGEGTVCMATKDAGEEASGLGSKPGLGLLWPCPQSGPGGLREHPMRWLPAAIPFKELLTPSPNVSQYLLRVGRNWVEAGWGLIWRLLWEKRSSHKT